jgi:hypothetical protein
LTPGRGNLGGEVIFLKRKLLGTGAGLGLITVLAFLAMGLSSPAKAAADEKKILLLHTNNVTGHLFPCPT